MRVINAIQGSDEWKRARAGKFTASRLADLMATTKSGPAASRKNYLAELLIERMTGEPTDHFVSKEMQWGTDHEGEARTLYEFEVDAIVLEVGFVLHPELDYAGASPDGLVGDDGCAEIKCPNTATHIETLRTRTVPDRYWKQMQWVMACTGRQWCDFISYDPRMKNDRLVMVRIRVERDDEFIRAAEAAVITAEDELNAMIDEMSQLAEGIA